MSAAGAVPFTHRGIVEGFYGPPFEDEDRRFLIGRLSALGMNRYVVAPKDAPWHRERWREPLPRADRDAFAALVAFGAEAGVEVGFALAPGLSIRYADPEERAALRARFAELAALGSRFFTLALDDVPSELVHEADRRAFRSLAAAHVALAHEVAEQLPAGAALWLVPTDYAGTRTSPYLEALGRGLAREIEVAWTGRTTVAPTIPTGEAAARAALLRRPLLLWDNVPVNDGPMRRMLHLGPYRGRDAGLADACSGVLLNPMPQARASVVALATAAAWLADPAAYAPEQAWARAVAEASAGAPEAFALFAAAHRFSALDLTDRDAELEAAFRTARDARGAREAAAWRALGARLEERVAVAARLREDLADRRLLAEIEPWVAAHHEETRRMRAAVDALLASLDPERSALDRALAVMVFEGSLTLHPPQAPVSYGPRRVLYPQLASQRAEAARFEGPSLLRGHCLADEVVEEVERRLLPEEVRA